MRLRKEVVMRRINSFLLACSIFLSLPAFSEEPPEVTKLQKGMPPAVADLISRIVDCNHWQGEESYDPERALQIERAISESRCTSLSADESAVLKSFGHISGVRNAIAAAREVYL
jgi:hypothetical protein